MILQEFLRYYKSKFNAILTVVLSIIVGASYYSTYLQKKEWVDVMHSGAKDVNVEKVSAIISGYTGSYYFESFLFSSDYNSLAALILLIGFGISLGSITFKSVQSNYGTMVVTRMSYKNYLKKVLIAQALYMSTYVIGFFLIVFVLTVLFLGGILISPNSFVGNLSIMQYLAFLGISIIHLSVYIIVIILITTVSPLFLKNRYVIQLFPFIIIMITYFISNVLGNVNEDLAFLTSFIVLDNILFSSIGLFNSSKSTLMIIMTSSIFIVISMIVFTFIYKANIKKFGQDYI
ncbi:hypothetical protein KUV80_10890 [Fictibacillus nanhaiensis]|uniref:hypothetical protein n=1 Tax=Fictibacillus nanhaiensis TaxID=742169 RepID=UPI001C93954B|nr:hypothetical protein [Fictibacillus nanhaiensis]MBY6037165.1 hypothetical protein [Fictibacillus nanhaiensis]